jgi:hypothetical protein
MKLVKLTFVASTLALLGGCVAVPIHSGYYDGPEPVYVAPVPAYYWPSLSIGVYGGYRGYARGHHRYGRGYGGRDHGYRGHGHGGQRR